MSSYNITTRKKDKGWQVIVSYKTLTGQWKQKSKQGFPTSRQAKDYGQVIIDSLAGQIFVESHELRHITFKELYHMYMAQNKARYAINTVLLYEYAFTRSSIIHNVKVIDVSTIQIMNIVNENDYSTTTRKHIRSKLSSIFNYAIKIQLLSKSPVTDVQVTSSSRNNRRIRTFSDDEIQTLLKYFNERKDEMSALLTELLSVTGLRIGEALGLTWDTVNLSSNTITINKQWTRIGNTEYGFAKTKTENSIRTLFVPNNVLSRLSALRTDDNRIFYKINMSATYTTKLKYVLPKHSPHDFRHTYATKLLSNGVDVKTAAALLGDTVNTIINTYLHYTDEMREQAKNDIIRIFEK